MGASYTKLPFNSTKQKVFVSRNVTFLEEDYSLNENITNVEFEEHNEQPMIEVDKEHDILSHKLVETQEPH